MHMDLYGDACKIGEHALVLFGSGKTSTQRGLGEEITNDCLYLERTQTNILAGFIMPMHFLLLGQRFTSEKKLEYKPTNLSPVKWMVNLLSQQTTHNSNIREAIELNFLDFTKLSDFNITFSLSLEGFFPVQKKELEKVQTFIEIIEPMSDKIKFYAIPWKETLEERVNLIKQII